MMIYLAYTQPFNPSQLRADLLALINPEIATFFGFAVTMAVVMRIFK
jgi:hypothetical protein